ncbi:MAG TPA: hypothetical protein VFX42_06600 [Gemmatimonadales bacterium]|nr:hypothetical protein [Gemmatimonadales bacterium]
MIRAFAVLLVGVVLSSGPLRIHYEPQVVDRHFTSRMDLCPGVPDSGGFGRANAHRQTIGEFLSGELREIVVHQIGDSFSEFAAVERQIRQVLAQRPQAFSRYSAWAEATPLAASGILATLRYTRGRSG